MGYGVWLRGGGDGFSYGHGGGDPGVEVYVRRFPAQDVNIVILCNMDDSGLGEIFDILAEAVGG
jgi:hypothetical protein